jgi:hypothetical protein
MQPSSFLPPDRTCYWVTVHPAPEGKLHGARAGPVLCTAVSGTLLNESTDGCARLSFNKQAGREHYLSDQLPSSWQFL